MSRIQKKKPVSEKLKQKAVQGKQKNTDNGFDKSVASKGSLKARPEKAAVETRSDEPNFIQKAIEFLREVKVELKKVTWPTKEQTTQTTIVVIIFVFIVAGFLGIFDLGLSKLVQVVLT